jgi:hypothetical protein
MGLRQKLTGETQAKIWVTPNSSGGLQATENKREKTAKHSP